MLINNFLRTLQTWKAAGTHPAHLALSSPGSPANPLQMTGSFKFLNATFLLPIGPFISMPLWVLTGPICVNLYFSKHFLFHILPMSNLIHV